MRFLIDHNVHAGVASLLERHGHEVHIVSKVLKQDADDHEVATTALQNNLILITHDKDFHAVDRRLSAKFQNRYPKLCRIMFCCDEEEAPSRLSIFLHLIDLEFSECRRLDAPMLLEVQQRRLRLHR